MISRHFAIAVVRRLFKMGPKMVERRLKTVRRLLHPLLVEMCAILKNDDGNSGVTSNTENTFWNVRNVEMH